MVLCRKVLHCWTRSRYVIGKSKVKYERCGKMKKNIGYPSICAFLEKRVYNSPGSCRMILNICIWIYQRTVTGQQGRAFWSIWCNKQLWHIPYSVIVTKTYTYPQTPKMMPWNCLMNEDNRPKIWHWILYYIEYDYALLYENHIMQHRLRDQPLGLLSCAGLMSVYRL